MPRSLGAARVTRRHLLCVIESANHVNCVTPNHMAGGHRDAIAAAGASQLDD
jgi:hypothetical protein